MSADLVSRIKPEYLGFLTLMLEGDTPMRREVESGKIQLLRPEEVLEEMRLFLSHADSPGTIFRANHASNYINLRGVLNQDIPAMIRQIESVNSTHSFKPENFRGL